MHSHKKNIHPYQQLIELEDLPKTNSEYRKEADQLILDGNNLFTNNDWDGAIDCYTLANKAIKNFKDFILTDHLTLAVNYFLMELAYSYQDEKDKAKKCNSEAVEELNKFYEKNKTAPVAGTLTLFEMLSKIGISFLENDHKKATDLFKISRRTLDRIKSENIPPDECRVLAINFTHAAKLYWDQGLSQNEKKYLQEAIGLYDQAVATLAWITLENLTADDYRIFGVCQDNIGRIYNNKPLKKRKKAIKYWECANEYFEHIDKLQRNDNDYENLIENYQQIGSDYYEEKNWQKAAENFEKLLAAKKSKGENSTDKHYRELAKYHCLTGNAFYHTSEPKQISINHYEQAIAWISKVQQDRNEEDDRLLATYHNNLAKFYGTSSNNNYSPKNSSQALLHFEEAIRLRRNLSNNHDELGKSLYKAGKIYYYYRKENVEKAIDYFIQAINYLSRVFDQENMKVILKCYLNLRNLFSKNHLVHQIFDIAVRTFRNAKDEYKYPYSSSYSYKYDMPRLYPELRERVTLEELDRIYLSILHFHDPFTFNCLLQLMEIISNNIKMLPNVSFLLSHNRLESFNQKLNELRSRKPIDAARLSAALEHLKQENEELRKEVATLRKSAVTNPLTQVNHGEYNVTKIITKTSALGANSVFAMQPNSSVASTTQVQITNQSIKSYPLNNCS